ncbi:MAG: hypothetical protein IKQ13_03775 [Treponema sp.]|jgi:hypothetical protein|nr:hypothetical protein [Treponema sp.]
MNKKWSELNKTMQTQISKKESFEKGKETLFSLRDELFSYLKKMQQEEALENFSKMPFMNSKGYHNKSIAYSLWHIFRIEDIVAHELIQKNEEILFSADFVSKIKSPIITTGNELVKEEILKFSQKLDISELFNYCEKVKQSTDSMLQKLVYEDLKTKYADADKTRLKKAKVVSEDENAFWLIDYWCGKNLKGLIQMPFSRHWIMHIEAISRIRERLG